jgi:hypothetical protein
MGGSVSIGNRGSPYWNLAVPDFTLKSDRYPVPRRGPSRTQTTATDMTVAIVTGASRGIGKAIALQLADDGMDVAVSSRPLLTRTHVRALT